MKHNHIFQIKLIHQIAKIYFLFSTQKSLFGGLEEFDSSIEESFSLKPNAKRLNIKPKFPKVLTTGSTTPNPNTSLSIVNAQDLSPITSAEERRLSQIPSTSNEFESTRRVSWLHSNLDKVAIKNRGETDSNTTMQEMVSGKTKSSITDKSNLSPGILRQDTNRSNISLQHKNLHFSGLNANDSILSTKSFLEDTNADISLINTEPHPTGIIMQRSGYYTIPPLDKLTDFLTEDGKCIVPNFTIGRFQLTYTKSIIHKIGSNSHFDFSILQVAKDTEMFILVNRLMLPI